MKNTFLALGLLALTSIAPASAAVLVSFSTSNTTNCGTNASCVAAANALSFSALPGGSGTLVYNIAPNAGDNLNVTPGNPEPTSFGTISVNCVSCAVGSQFSINGAFVGIALNQTNPFAASTNPAVIGTFNGSIELTAVNTYSTLGHRITFGADTGQSYVGSVGPINYTVDYALAVQNGVPNNGYSLSVTNQTSLQAFVSATSTDTTIPEPTSVALMGVGLVALATAARRRRS